MTEKKETPVQAYTKFQLYKMYGVGARTFNKWIEPFKEELGPKRGREFTPQQVRIIFSHLDPP